MKTTQYVCFQTNKEITQRFLLKKGVMLCGRRNDNQGQLEEFPNIGRGTPSFSETKTPFRGHFPHSSH